MISASRTIFIAGCGLLAVTASADTLYESEFKRLSEQRDSDLAAYSLKVNRAYRAALEKLLGPATQAKDYATVAKIVEAMKGVSEAAPVDPMAPPAGHGSRIDQLLTEKKWVLAGLRYTFLKSGNFTRAATGSNKIDRGTYKVNGNTVELNWSNGDRAAMNYDEKSGGFIYSFPAWPAIDGKLLTPSP